MGDFALSPSFLRGGPQSIRAMLLGQRREARQRSKRKTDRHAPADRALGAALRAGSFYRADKAGVLFYVRTLARHKLFPNHHHDGGRTKQKATSGRIA